MNLPRVALNIFPLYRLQSLTIVSRKRLRGKVNVPQIEKINEMAAGPSLPGVLITKGIAPSAWSLSGVVTSLSCAFLVNSLAFAAGEKAPKISNSFRNNLNTERVNFASNEYLSSCLAPYSSFKTPRIVEND